MAVVQSQGLQVLQSLNKSLRYHVGGLSLTGIPAGPRFVIQNIQIILYFGVCMYRMSCGVNRNVQFKLSVSSTCIHL